MGSVIRGYHNYISCNKLKSKVAVTYVIQSQTNFSFSFSGKYKVEMFDSGKNRFVPTQYGLGMHVDIRDPDDRIILSRVRDWKLI